MVDVVEVVDCIVVDVVDANFFKYLNFKQNFFFTLEPVAAMIRESWKW